MHEKNQMTIPHELFGPWKNLDESKLQCPKNFKYKNRNYTLKVQWQNCLQLIPDYLKHQNKSVIDISAANGSALEIFKYFNYKVLAIDYFLRPGKYELFLQSQNIPYINHDCSILPYPIKDQSFDLLLNFGAITQYDVNVDVWPKILDEFARITKKTIAVIINNGWKTSEGKKYLKAWNHPQFNLTMAECNKFRWDSK